MTQKAKMSRAFTLNFMLSYCSERQGARGRRWRRKEGRRGRTRGGGTGQLVQVREFKNRFARLEATGFLPAFARSWESVQVSGRPRGPQGARRGRGGRRRPSRRRRGAKKRTRTVPPVCRERLRVSVRCCRSRARRKREVEAGEAADDDEGRGGRRRVTHPGRERSRLEERVCRWSSISWVPRASESGSRDEGEWTHARGCPRRRRARR